MMKTALVTICSLCPTAPLADAAQPSFSCIQDEYESRIRELKDRRCPYRRGRSGLPDPESL